ncbi:MAG TPA: nitronate monooxygenase [Thermoanaerobaculia bacterium]|jgi:nitronate monooxygenase
MALWSNAFTRAARLELPIVQAPMAGGSTTPELVAAVSNAGALGSYAAAYAQPAEIAAAIDAIRARTPRPFAVNVFAPHPAGEPGDAAAMLEVMARLYAELGLAPPSLPARPPIVLDEQLAVLLETRVPIVSFTFGVLPEDAIAALKGGGALLVGTATTVAEAIALERRGVDAVVAQGSEAGGHRGSFDTAGPAGMIGTMALVPQIAGAVDVPVIAAGGIMDGRGIVAAHALGASAVQLGTAFLTCDESGMPRAVKDALLGANENDTVVTDAMTGRHGRAVRNRLIATLEAAGVPPLGFAWQSALLGGLRRAAVEQGRADLLPLFAGQGLRLLRTGPAGELVRALAREAEETMGALGS